MDAGNVMLVEQDMMAPVIVILAITDQMVCKQNICASNLLTGLLSKFRVSLLIIQKACSNHS